MLTTTYEYVLRHICYTLFCGCKDIYKILKMSLEQDSNLRIVVLQTTVLATSPSGHCGNGKIRTFDSRKGSASLAGRWFKPLTHASDY